MLRFICGCPCADNHNKKCSTEEEAKESIELQLMADPAGGAVTNMAGMIMTPVLLQMVLSAICPGHRITASQYVSLLFFVHPMMMPKHADDGFASESGT